MSNPYIGLRKNARSPGSIENAQHHDQSGSQKNIDGIPGAIDRVVADSTIATPIKSFQMVRVCNTDTATQYIWVGKEGSAPVTINFASAFALPAGESTIIHCTASDDDMKSIVVKSSSALVQVVVIES